jgi:hypothetical protein
MGPLVALVDVLGNHVFAGPSGNLPEAGADRFPRADGVGAANHGARLSLHSHWAAVFAGAQRDRLAVKAAADVQHVAGFLGDEEAWSPLILQHRQRLEPDLDEEVLVIEVEVLLRFFGDHRGDGRPLAEVMALHLGRPARGRWPKGAKRRNREQESGERLAAHGLILFSICQLVRGTARRNRPRGSGHPAARR